KEAARRPRTQIRRGSCMIDRAYCLFPSDGREGHADPSGPSLHRIGHRVVSLILADGMENAELKRRTFHSVAWTVARVATTNVLSLVVFSVLARILSPHDFGAFALATVVVEFTRIVAAAGLGDAVLRTKHLDDAFADTAFWANLMLGCFVGATTWVAAPFYASIIRQPEVVPILRWLAV